MDENICLPSLHPNSDHNSSEHNQIGFTTLSDERNEYFPPSSKRPRGRPSGSKNKPKNHDLLEEEIDNTLNLIVVEIPAGNDIAERLINVAHSHNASITVLSGWGFVSDVTLLHSVSRVPAAPMAGPFNMISLSGTYINPNSGLVHPQLIKNPSCSSFSIHLSGTLGQVYGGFVGGKVMAASQVMITATLFNQSVFHKLPSTSRSIEEDDEEDAKRYVVGVTKC